MNRMRFGAMLLNHKQQLGLYLSHRVILTVPEPGYVRAVTTESFGKCQVFAHNQVAIQFFPALMAAANSKKKFAGSLEMMNEFLQVPENTSLLSLCKYMQQKHGAKLLNYQASKLESMETTNQEQERNAKMNDYDLKNDFFEKYEEAKKVFCKRPNILVCGYTGSGKTSLIKAILGDVVPEEAIGTGAPKTMGYDCYENEQILVWDSKGLEMGETEEEFTSKTRQFVRERQTDPNVDNHIHLIWYTIQGSGARVTECDKNLLQNIFSNQNVIVAVTKDDGVREAQRRELQAAIEEAGIPAERIVFTTDEEGGSRGCRDLVHLSMEMLPEAYKNAFVDAQEVDREMKIKAVYDKANKAKAIIATGVTAAAGVGAVPIPMSDAALLMPIQVTMIVSLAALYGLREEAIKQSAWPFVAKLVGVMTATSLLKLIPFLGSFVNAGVAASITGAMGWYVKQNFETAAIARIKGKPQPELIFDAELFKQFFAEYQKK